MSRVQSLVPSLLSPLRDGDRLKPDEWVRSTEVVTGWRTGGYSATPRRGLRNPREYKCAEAFDTYYFATGFNAAIASSVYSISPSQYLIMTS